MLLEQILSLLTRVSSLEGGLSYFWYVHFVVLNNGEEVSNVIELVVGIQFRVNTYDEFFFVTLNIIVFQLSELYQSHSQVK